MSDTPDNLYDLAAALRDAQLTSAIASAKREALGKELDAARKADMEAWGKTEEAKKALIKLAERIP